MTAKQYYAGAVALSRNAAIMILLSVLLFATNIDYLAVAGLLLMYFGVCRYINARFMARDFALVRRKKGDELINACIGLQKFCVLALDGSSRRVIWLADRTGVEVRILRNRSAVEISIIDPPPERARRQAACQLWRYRVESYTGIATLVKSHEVVTSYDDQRIYTIRLEPGLGKTSGFDDGKTELTSEDVRAIHSELERLFEVFDNPDTLAAQSGEKLTVPLWASREG